MKKEKLLKKLQHCKEECLKLQAENEALKEQLEEYSYSIERKNILTQGERIEMLLVGAEKVCKRFKHDEKNIMCFYNQQTKLFAQKYRDMKKELEALQLRNSEAKEVLSK